MPNGASKDIGKTVNEYHMEINKLNDELAAGQKKINETLAGSDIAKKLMASNQGLDKSSNWRQLLQTQLDRLKGEAEQAKEELKTAQQWNDNSPASNKNILEAQDKAGAIAQQQINLQKLLDGAKRDSDALWDAFSGKSQNALTSMNIDLKDALAKPFDAGLKAVTDYFATAEKHSKEFRDKNLEHINEVAKSLNEEGRTPLQKYLDEMKQLDVLLQSGKLKQGAFDVLSKKDLKEMDSEEKALHPRAEHQLAPLQQHTDSAGVNLGLPKIADPLVKLNDTAKQQLAEQRKLTTLTEKQVTAFNSGDIQLVF